MIDDTYNGWANRETWAASLHLSNDQALVGTVEALTEEALERVAGDIAACTIPGYTIDRRQRTISYAADALSALVEDWAQDAKEAAGGGYDAAEPVGQTVAMMLDEIGSRWRVDWRAVVASYVDQVIEDQAVTA